MWSRPVQRSLDILISVRPSRPTLEEDECSYFVSKNSPPPYRAIRPVLAKSCLSKPLRSTACCAKISPQPKSTYSCVNRNHFERRREESYSTCYAGCEDGLLSQLGLIPRRDLSSINWTAITCRRTTATFLTLRCYLGIQLIPTGFRKDFRMKDPFSKGEEEEDDNANSKKNKNMGSRW